MKQRKWIMVTFLMVITACSKYGDYGTKTWTKEEQAYYNKVITLQDSADSKYTIWSKTMDSVEAIKKLKQYFLADTSVTSATIGSQGIAVQYSNGMRGGIFLDSPDNRSGESLGSNSQVKSAESSLTLKSLVNKKKTIILDPGYWQWTSCSDLLEKGYKNWLPKAGFSLPTRYINHDAVVDRYTELANYGFIQFDAHGLAWPRKDSISEVYTMTGELANLVTSAKYWQDIYHGDILINKTKDIDGVRKNTYWISPNFVSSHNDFSKDTVLFIGGFCFSFLGDWSQLYNKFAAGAYFGYDWIVRTNKHQIWALSLMDSLCDTLTKPPYNPSKWIKGTNPAKSYYNETDRIWVNILYAGDPSLSLWNVKDESGTFTYDGRSYKYKTIGTQIWMTENLAYLPAVSPALNTFSTTLPNYFVYNYSGTDINAAKATTNYKTYGVLYNWAAAKIVCPSGWHLPSDEEWKILEMSQGMSEAEANGKDSRESGKVGLKLMEKGTTHWDNPNSGATNSSGFTALPGGDCWFFWGFDNLAHNAYFWSASEDDSLHAWNRYLYESYDGVHRYNDSKGFGFSVRCVKN